MAEPTAVEIVNIPLWVDICAVSLGAITGALVAVRQRFDIGGIVLIAILTGLGGGLIRDTLLQRGTPVALTSPWLLPTAVLGGLLISLFSRTVDRLHRPFDGWFMVLDAIFLAVYAVVGTAKGLEAGLPAVTCVLLGVFTGVGGGMLRDVLINDQPAVLRPGTFMATAAAIGCTAAVLLVRQFHLSKGVGAVGIVAIVGIRRLSVWRGWESPLATDVAESARRLPDRVQLRRSARRRPHH